MNSRRPVRVLLVHNSYRQPGGEDRVFATEARVLREHGHEVFTFTRQNPGTGSAAVLRLASQTFWNHRTYVDLRQLISRTAPDVVHLHNTFPLISPAACYAARHEHVAVVQTLHNYRLLCPNGLFFRNGRPCEDCLHVPIPWPAVIHACYRGSYTASLAAGGTIALHRALGTWANQVDRFVALTEFGREKFIAGGLPADRIVVKPNLVFPDLGPGTGDGGFALFAGRLSEEKGIRTLLAAWNRKVPMPLTIVGDGPLSPLVRRTVAENRNVSWLGYRTHEELQTLVGRAACVVVPSIWSETFGLIGAEAFARGTPVVAARFGALIELVEHERTGLMFAPGDPDDLARQITSFSERPTDVARMRAAARAEYEKRYSVESNYPSLSLIYDEAIASARARQTN